MMTIKNALDKLDIGAKEKITDKYGALVILKRKKVK